jgi:hypothetical protein
MKANHRLVVSAAASALLPLLLCPRAAHAQRAPSPLDIHVTDLRVSPRRVRPGGVVRVSMMLSKGAQGPIVARSMRPSARTVYTQGESFRSRGFSVQEGRYGIVVALSGPRGRQWPYRWGLGGDLAQGQRRRVSYPLRLTEPGLYSIYVGVAHGGEIRELSPSGAPSVEVVGSGRRARLQPNLRLQPPPTRITVNGREVSLDQPPVFYRSRITVSPAQILIPIRFVVEALGAQVDWRPQTRTARIRRGEYDLRLRVGQEEHLLNGKTIETHVPPRIINGRTMVPIRFVSQSMGGTVNWDSRTRTVAIDLPELSARP